LKAERAALSEFIDKRGNQCEEFDLRLEPVMWELEPREVTDKRAQDKYNEHLGECDIAIFMFGSRIGEHTKEEFDFALESKKNPDSKPNHI
jgi:hypothetical protein